jgi:taurine dioxygenase
VISRQTLNTSENAVEDGVPVGSLGAGDLVWHTDMSYGTLHPLVCIHPETGRRCLYLGRRRNAYIAGLALTESEALLDELWTYVDRREFSWEHVWRVGDLVLWDNRCTMHRRDSFDPNTRRIMHRTQVKGDARPA